MKNPIILSVIWFFLIANALPVSGQDMQTPARSAYIIDLSTDTILFQKEADVALPPASMSKLMTVYIAFDLIKRGSLSLDDEFVVSRKAWKKGGSKMFVKVGDRVKVADLLRGVIVQSGNDACIVLAEGISGNEDAFANLMTLKGEKLGLTHSQFANSTGWPHPKHRMSARDLAKLSQLLIETFPELYKIFSEKTFTYNGIKQGNRNPLLYRDMDSDGLKTGHTRAAGYGLTASAIREGRRIVLVLNGLKNVRQRFRESQRLMEWAFRNFEPYTLFKKDEEVTKVDVWLGTTAKVPVIIPRKFMLTLSRAAREKLKVIVRMQSPVAAPVTLGQKLAVLVVTAPGIGVKEVPLIAGKSVEQLGFLGRIGAAVKHVLWGSS